MVKFNGIEKALKVKLSGCGVRALGLSLGILSGLLVSLKSLAAQPSPQCFEARSSIQDLVATSSGGSRVTLSELRLALISEHVDQGGFKVPPQAKVYAQLNLGTAFTLLGRGYGTAYEGLVRSDQGSVYADFFSDCDGGSIRVFEPNGRGVSAGVVVSIEYLRLDETAVVSARQTPVTPRFRSNECGGVGAEPKRIYSIVSDNPSQAQTVPAGVQARAVVTMAPVACRNYE